MAMNAVLLVLMQVGSPENLLKGFRMNNSSIRNESCDNIDFSLDQTFLPVLYGLVFCIGLPTNCLALYGLYRLVRTDNALPVYVINLLLSDLLQISTLPLWIDYYSHGHIWCFENTLCKITGVIFWISQSVSIFFMLCVALERYIMPPTLCASEASVDSRDSCDYEARIFIYFQIGMGFLSLNSLLDPFLYIFVCGDVRKEMLYSFPCFQKLASERELWKIIRSAKPRENASNTFHEVSPTTVYSIEL
ncbi:G-protein coupled receptor 4-like [Acipenser oxyrinchus oxyrinchus]|uniref:G-protein coupled receptor 4-like n=1 Tax=Acipenser oxyrinchus oxyrinchus TaxID=40147 RepID=A0AAD8CIL1_ACIOX|nr:G-protein coupled receptor 4-like [Acipenser oxyrinchus oxyrinchus]